jgi:hypothetical protein
MVEFVNEQFTKGNHTLKDMEKNMKDSCQQLYTYITTLANSVEEIKTSLCVFANKS